MLKKALLLFAVALICLSSFAKGKKDITVVFYNVENLFDTINNPDKRDNDFTPMGKLQWNTKRYNDKISKLSYVLSSIDKEELPALVGLCEIENKDVLEDLIDQEKLKDGKYKIAHSESPDKRGIDCALIYQKSRFKYIKHETISIEFPWEKEYKTRDILYVQGLVGRKDTLNIFVNHWPSRRGGQEKSEPNRIFVAQQLKKAVDKIQAKNPFAKIIIMGDFNDEPTDKAVAEVLKAGNNRDTDNPMQLFNLMYDMKINGEGTYNYRGTWNMLDNLIVSNSLLNGSRGYQTLHNAGRIYRDKWICFKNKKGILTPNKTYGGTKYYGGFSDHFPVYFKLKR
ncbi:endonuclease [Ancylomarina salipaludis]|uniref:Endonuclease n=1 Tax=Ancylomarina salipaludis TaxID=2501299 RepID=A0A4Q1JLZ7_9BACT|nr:endonuclease [Ancylomarina salipaludis]RXQ93975.1 endonuclease [Ancylomarina salipaludis]